MDNFGNSHSDEDLYDALSIMDKVFGTTLRTRTHSRRYSDSDVDTVVENELALRALYLFIKGSTTDKEIIKNLNDLVVSGNINNVQLIKR